MAASGSTTIQLYNSSTASAVPTSGNLVQGELGINVTDKKIYTKNASAAVVVVGFGPDASVALTALTGLTVSSGGASITGNTSVTGSLGATGAFSLGSSSLNGIGDFHGQGGVGAYVRFADDANNATRGFIGYGGTLFGANLSDFGIRSQGNLLLSSYGTVAATFDSNQNLLVGTTNATVGTAVGGRWVADDTDAPGSRLELGSSASTNSSVGFDMYSTGAGAYRFYVGYGGTIFATSTSISAISDISLKENIRELDTGLSEVMRLKPRRFDWKNGDGANVAGFIAQELEEVLPELVYDYQYNADTTKKSIKMGDILPTLVKAVQELNEKVDKLEAEKVSLLLTLKSVEGIEARLAALEAA